MLCVLACLGSCDGDKDILSIFYCGGTVTAVIRKIDRLYMYVYMYMYVYVYAYDLISKC